MSFHGKLKRFFLSDFFSCSGFRIPSPISGPLLPDPLSFAPLRAVANPSLHVMQFPLVNFSYPFVSCDLSPFHLYIHVSFIRPRRQIGGIPSLVDLGPFPRSVRRHPKNLACPGLARPLDRAEMTDRQNMEMRRMEPRIL